MAKVSRAVLKSLVKECLVEILSEGLVGASEQIQESKQISSRRTAPAKKRKPVKKDVIPETVKGITDDPLMQSIFADTARTTLQEQTNAERNPRVIAGDTISTSVAQEDLGDLFGEAANNWASLAFSEKKLPGQHK
ncbi:MAG: hypothetical protein CMB77_04250 [Euryarchaeota archaeon]|nr:hypothetical protein [Euryarchaeota archaeon]|tara:strand:+ start:31704 stop:32111 length:408 start_codon:yes stop_codon:yes gene_type:complete